MAEVKFPFWQTIPPETQLSELVGTSMLLTTHDYRRAVVCTVGQGSEGDFALRWAKLPDLQYSRHLRAMAGRFKDRNWEMQMGRDYEIVAIPPIQWKRGGKGLPGRTVLMVAVAVLTATLLILFGGVQGALFALPAAAVTAAIAWAFMRETLPARILTAGNLELDGTNLVDYSIARRIGERPELLTDDQRREDIRQRIDGILTEYGELASDIVYRIENSALFDSAIPATEAFQVAMVRYQTEAEDLSLDALDELATELEITYSVARDHAETVGLAHLPSTARPDARRAAKAARLAAGAATDGERAAAMDQVVRILDSLALYYLPGRELVRGAITNGRDDGSRG